MTWESRVITCAEIMPLLLQACPAFQATWDAHLRYWGEQEPGIYNNTAEFVHYLDDCRQREDIPPLTSAFIIIERLLSEGDAQTQEIATIGIIETLQNVASHSGAAEFYVPFLGPNSRHAWSALNRDWARLMSWKANRGKN